MHTAQNNLENSATGFYEDSLQTVTFAAVGDLMCHGTQLKWAKVSPDSFDFKPVYSEIKKYLSKPDVTIGNLETVTRNNAKYKGYPVFNSPVEYIEALAYAGFDFLATANNHSTDGNKKGIINTIENTDKYNMHYVGTFLNQRDRDSIRVYKKNNISFSMLSYTYGLNIYNLSDEDSYMVNVIDTTLIWNDISNARSEGADVIIVYLHAGHENHKEPGSYQRRITNKLLEYGVDVILSTSPHVLQPIDVVANPSANLDSTLIVYSMGNFISNQRWRYSDCGVIINFSISKNSKTGKLFLTEVEYMPVWVYKGWADGIKQYIIHPSEISITDVYPPYFSKSDEIKMKQSFEDSKAILTKYSGSPKLKSIYKYAVMEYDSIDAPIKPFDLGN